MASPALTSRRGSGRRGDGAGSALGSSRRRGPRASAASDAASDAAARPGATGAAVSSTPRKPGRAARARARRARERASSAASSDRRRVFLGGVAPGATEADLVAALAQDGEVLDVFLHDARNFAFATFSREEDAARAIARPPGHHAPIFAEARATAIASEEPEVAHPRTEPEMAHPRTSPRDRLHHTTPPRSLGLDAARRATLAVQCQESHADRVAAHLERALGLVVVGIAAPDEPPEVGRRVTERVVLARAAEDGETAADAAWDATRRDDAIRARPDFFPRVYDVRGGDAYATLREAADAAMDAIARFEVDEGFEGVEGDETTTTLSTVRLSTFPPSVVRSSAMRDAAASRPEATRRLSPRADASVALLSLRGGAHVVGRCARDDERGGESVHVSESRDDEGAAAASRAHAKLAEAALRCDAFRVALEDAKTAVDVGAAPGGWTQFLASRGVAVVAVDPAEIPDLPSGCRHLRETAESAWTRLRAETERKAANEARPVETRASPPFDVYVSDAVLHDADAQERLLAGAVDAGLLRDGATVVVTFKSAPGRGAGEGYERAARARAESLGRRLCDEWELVHLFANRRRERTFVGRLRRGAKPPRRGA